jgi:hypothetical protein
MRSVLFTPAAQAEVIEAQDWYEREAQGLAEACAQKSIEWFNNSQRCWQMCAAHGCAGFPTGCPFMSSKTASS